MQGRFNLLVRVFHNEDMVVDELLIIRNFTSKTFTAPAVFNGASSIMSIELSFRLLCSDNFYGDLCDTFCTPRDNPGGHYTCNFDTGEKECIVGYVDVSTGCTMLCIDSDACGEGDVQRLYTV